MFVLFKRVVEPKYTPEGESLYNLLQKKEEPQPVLLWRRLVFF